LIIKYSTYIIKNKVNRLIKLYTKDLILYNIIVIKGFYINIISKTCLINISNNFLLVYKLYTNSYIGYKYSY
jgi:hypothetical protein